MFTRLIKFLRPSHIFFVCIIIAFSAPQSAFAGGGWEPSGETETTADGGCKVKDKDKKALQDAMDDLNGGPCNNACKLKMICENLSKNSSTDGSGDIKCTVSVKDIKDWANDEFWVPGPRVKVITCALDLDRDNDEDSVDQDDIADALNEHYPINLNGSGDESST